MIDENDYCEICNKKIDISKNEKAWFLLGLDGYVLRKQ